MLEAALNGGLGGSSLLLGAYFSFKLHPSRRIIGLIMAFGAGSLISSVATNWCWKPPSPETEHRSPGASRLTMLSDTMMPEAYEFSGKAVGSITTLGFCVAFFISSFE